MKRIAVLCVVVVLAGVARAAVLPLKAGLTPKDKLVLQTPLKDRSADGSVKVRFPQDIIREFLSTVMEDPAATTAASTTTTAATTTTTAASSSTTAASTTTTAATSTTAAASTEVPQRPQYVDAAVFRHQFPEPSTPAPYSPSIANLESPRDYTAAVAAALASASASASEPSHDYDLHFGLWEDLSPFEGEIGSFGGDVRSEAFIGGFRPLGF